MFLFCQEKEIAAKIWSGNEILSESKHIMTYRFDVLESVKRTHYVTNSAEFKQKQTCNSFMKNAFLWDASPCGCRENPRFGEPCRLSH
jgi:hypothetical protein